VGAGIFIYIPRKSKPFFYINVCLDYWHYCTDVIQVHAISTYVNHLEIHWMLNQVTRRIKGI
jgi:hypothetical protein